MRFKNTIVILIGVIFLSGCAGFSLFPDAKPFCTPDEQIGSVIYEYLDPATTDFVMMVGTATFLEKYPIQANALIRSINRAKALVENGVTYEVFAEELMKILGPLQYVVVSPILNTFIGIELPINECDKRMILGHLDKQLNLAELSKTVKSSKKVKGE